MHSGNTRYLRYCNNPGTNNNSPLDTAGQDDYAMIREAYYQTGDGKVYRK